MTHRARCHGVVTCVPPPHRWEPHEEAGWPADAVVAVDARTRLPRDGRGAPPDPVDAGLGSARTDRRRPSIRHDRVQLTCPRPQAARVATRRPHWRQVRLVERIVHGVGARQAGSDWTAHECGAAASTGSVCRSSANAKLCTRRGVRRRNPSAIHRPRAVSDDPSDHRKRSGSYPRQNTSSIVPPASPARRQRCCFATVSRRSAASRAARCRFLLQRPRACNPIEGCRACRRLHRRPGFGRRPAYPFGPVPLSPAPLVEAVRRRSADDVHRRRHVAVVHGAAVSTRPGRRHTLGRPARFGPCNRTPGSRPPCGPPSTVTSVPPCSASLYSSCRRSSYCAMSPSLSFRPRRRPAPGCRGRNVLGPCGAGTSLRSAVAGETLCYVSGRPARG